MDTQQHLANLERHGRVLGDAAERAGLDAAVPGCPGWDVRALLAHIGMVHRWAATHIREGLAAFDHNRQRPDFPAPRDGVLTWYRQGHATLVSALREAPDDLDAMTFLADAGPARAFWARRQAHETAIHSADALAAVGETPKLDDDFALDGIAELLEGFYARQGGRLRSQRPVGLRIAPTDAPTAWLIRIGPDGRDVRRDGAGDVDATVRGASVDLYLDLWNRRPANQVDFSGDPAVRDLWRAAAKVQWR